VPTEWAGSSAPPVIDQTRADTYASHRQYRHDDARKKKREGGSGGGGDPTDRRRAGDDR